MNKIIIGDATLYCGDTIKILPTLGECADLLISDPPYELESGGNNADWNIGEKDYTNNGKIVTCNIGWNDFMPLLYNSLRGDAHAYIMCNNKHLRNLLNSAFDCGFRDHNMLLSEVEEDVPIILPWKKNSATPNRWYMKNCEFTGFFFKGKAKYINDCGCKQSISVPQENYGNHPTTKPVALMEYYIRNSSQPLETVIDPFMGVGSTAIAALKSGRKFIGIELEQKWFDLSVKRITDFYDKPQQNNLF